MDIWDEGRGGIKDEFNVSRLFVWISMSLSKIEAIASRRSLFGRTQNNYEGI